MNILSALVYVNPTLSLLTLADLHGVTLYVRKKKTKKKQKPLIIGNDIKIYVACLIEVYQVSL